MDDLYQGNQPETDGVQPETGGTPGEPVIANLDSEFEQLEQEIAQIDPDYEQLELDMSPPEPENVPLEAEEEKPEAIPGPVVTEEAQVNSKPARKSLWALLKASVAMFVAFVSVCSLLVFGIVVAGIDFFSYRIVVKAPRTTTVEYGQSVESFDADAYLIRGLFGGIQKAKVHVDENVDISSVGTYDVKVTAQAKSNWLIVPRSFKKTVTCKVVVQDTVAPEIVLFTSEIPSNYPGSPYVEEGFQAIDGCDGDITDRVVSEQKGDQVFYSVTDNSGNVATAVRDIVYREDISANGKTIYLTFDDGPGKYTEQLLDVLAKYNVKVTFFVVGTDHPQIMARIAKEGHSIGVHSYSHRLKEIYKSEEEFFADVEEMQMLIEEHTGKRTNLLRFPGGSSNSFSRYNEGIMTRLSEEVTKRGYVYFDWNVDSLDASGATTAEEVFENVKIGVEEKEISVVLQHDIKDFSVEAVEMIIQWGLENGYTFRALDESSPTCQHKIYN